MNQFSSVRLPVALNSYGLEADAAKALDTAQFDARQVEFIQAVFGYAAYLSRNDRETPVVDAFLATFVNLLETMPANAPGEASACALRLQRIIDVIFPTAGSDTFPPITGMGDMDGAGTIDGADGVAASRRAIDDAAGPSC
ncbi:MAG: hypothetical protein WCA85_07785 [Paraburkholderia sp.]|uniref:hypothetical protein n=1 Tax=Paraburkholderia sp. TaxID=1926495 RepID=UPI003C427955